MTRMLELMEMNQ